MGGEAILKMGLRNWRAPHIFLAHGVQGLHDPGDLGLETPQAAVIGVRRQAEITRIFNLRKEAVVPAIERLRLFFCWDRPTRRLFLREEQVLELMLKVSKRSSAAQMLKDADNASIQRMRVRRPARSASSSKFCKMKEATPGPSGSGPSRPASSRMATTPSA